MPTLGTGEMNMPLCPDNEFPISPVPGVRRSTPIIPLRDAEERHEDEMQPNYRTTIANRGAAQKIEFLEE